MIPLRQNMIRDFFYTKLTLLTDYTVFKDFTWTASFNLSHSL